MALAERRLVDIEFVGIDLALHDVFAKPVRAGDENDVAKARLRVEGEDHAARGAIRTDHFHHADREADFEVIEAVVDAIYDGPVGED